MTERLDQIESILVTTAERLERTAEQAESSQREVESLIEGISNLAVLAEGNERRLNRLEKLIEANSQASAANATRFDILSLDARADRQAANRDRAAWQAGFSEQIAGIRLLRLDVRSPNERTDDLEQAS